MQITRIGKKPCSSTRVLLFSWLGSCSCIPRNVIEIIKAEKFSATFDSREPWKPTINDFMTPRSSKNIPFLESIFPRKANKFTIKIEITTRLTNWNAEKSLENVENRWIFTFWTCSVNFNAFLNAIQIT